MKGKQKRKGKGEDERPPEPRWKQQKPPARRRKARRNEAAAGKIASAAQLSPGSKSRERAGRTARGGEAGGGGREARKPGLHLPAVRLSWRRLALLPLLALLAFGGWELSTSDRFYVMQPEVTGNVRVPADAIIAASGIHTTHILWVSGSAVAARVKQVEGIAGASVHVRLPNQVIIDIRERTPLLVWKVAGQEVWVSEDGEPMPAVGAAPALTLTDPGGAAAVAAAPQNGGQATPGGTGAATAMTITFRLRPQVLAEIETLAASRPEARDLFYGRQEGLYFVTPEGWSVYLGDQGDVARKLATLQAVREKAAAEGAPLKLVDLRLEGQAFYR